MVQQKIVMKVQMNCEKGRTKAMKIAAVEEGMQTVHQILTLIICFRELDSWD
jgi:hypothetical protein